MPRPPSSSLTDGELELLNLLWEFGPSGLSRLCEGLRRQRPVATTTVATMLKVMLGKGLVTRRKKAGTPPVWEARLSKDAAHTRLLGRLLERAFDGSARRLVTHLVEDGRLSEDDLDEIRTLFDAHRRDQESAP